MGWPGNNGAVLTVCPLRQGQSRATLEGIWLAAFPPEISTSENVVTDPFAILSWHMPIRFSPVFPQVVVDFVQTYFVCTRIHILDIARKTDTPVEAVVRALTRKGDCNAPAGKQTL